MTTSHKIIVGLSGGVDSSVSAFLLQEQGYDVEGLFMKNWEEDDTDAYCSAATDLADAESVCETLGIPLHKVNFAAEYWDGVFEHFLQEYQVGRTPNPDILCNKEIKFKAFLDYAKKLGASHIATGHYARHRLRDGKMELLRGLDAGKDQSYFLYTLNQAQLSATIFPVGELPKPEVRAIAQKMGLKTHDKKDSTGICFIGERRFKDFLSRYLPAQPGNIETDQGRVIGTHDGLMYHTLGQRQGLKIGGLRDANELPWYVAAKDVTRNVLIVVQGHDHPLLYRHHLTARQLHFVSGIIPELLNCTAKIRYRSLDVPCTVKKISDDEIAVNFAKPEWAVTPGQSIVFYQDEICLGGGVIV